MPERFANIPFQSRKPARERGLVEPSRNAILAELRKRGVKITPERLRSIERLEQQFDRGQPVFRLKDKRAFNATTSNLLTSGGLFGGRGVSTLVDLLYPGV